MKKNWQIWAVALAVGWLLGSASGMVITRWSHPRGFPSHHMKKKFARQLHLTPDQQARLDVILTQKHEKMKALMAETRPKFEAIRNDTRADIRQILTPDQQAAFEKLDARMQERRSKRFQGMDDPPPPEPPR